MSRLSVDTSLWLAGVFMFITGAGIGMVMQVLVLATQNAVPHADLGVATSGATFFPPWAARWESPSSVHCSPTGSATPSPPS